MSKYWVPVGGKGYFWIIKDWFDKYGLNGNGASVGEIQSNWPETKEVIMENYPEIISLNSVDCFYSSDIVWDIVDPYVCEVGNPEIFDFIICQSALEHVWDPSCAMKNMGNALVESGLLFIHTHAPGVEYHGYPNDHFRFFEDIFHVWSEKFNLELLELEWDHNIFALYKKKGPGNWYNINLKVK